MASARGSRNSLQVPWGKLIDDNRSEWVTGLGYGKFKETERWSGQLHWFTLDFGIRPFEGNLGTQRLCTVLQPLHDSLQSTINIWIRIADGRLCREYGATRLQ